MKPTIWLFLLLIGSFTACKNPQTINKVIVHLEKQTNFAFKCIDSLSTNNLVLPRSISDNTVRMVGPQDWTSGFFPGRLWIMYKLSGDEKWKKHAEHFTEKLKSQQFNKSTHDVGFMMFCSYGNSYSITPSRSTKEILVQSANSLITRYNERVGCIRSWDHHKDLYEYPVIIDNMMNLELLFWASYVTADPKYKKIALNHANTTLQNHFRKDFSSFHVVDYDSVTGKVLKKVTNQGYNDSSSWSRGQAWGLYGYTMCYRETKMIEYLRQAEKIANYLITHPAMPENDIPYWDLDAPTIPDEPRDASSAAIIASALIELAQFSDQSNRFLHHADNILLSLSNKPYLNDIGTYGGFILNHSTGNMPLNDEIDVPMVYADYYFMEALLRKQRLADNW